MTKLSKVVIIFLFSISSVSLAYDISLLKYGQENQPTLCYQLSTKYLRPSDLDAVKYCASNIYSVSLNKIEFENRFNYKSRAATRNILNEVNEVLEEIKTFLLVVNLKATECQRDFRKQCLTHRYLYNKGLSDFVNKLQDLRSDILNQSNICVDAKGAGCKSLVIVDPYLGTVPVRSFISEGDLNSLRAVLAVIDKQIVGMEKRKLWK